MPFSTADDDQREYMVPGFFQDFFLSVVSSVDMIRPHGCGSRSSESVRPMGTTLEFDATKRTISGYSV